MKTFLFLILCGVVSISVAKPSAPEVKVYTRKPGHVGEDNVLVCYLSGFQPPLIGIRLMKNEVEIPGGHLSDLVFEQSWQYYMTKHVAFTPEKGAKYSCRVTHEGITKDYMWDIDD